MEVNGTEACWNTSTCLLLFVQTNISTVYRLVKLINKSINHTMNKNGVNNFAGLDHFHLHACVFSLCLLCEPSCQSLFVSVWGGGNWFQSWTRQLQCWRTSDSNWMTVVNHLQGSRLRQSQNLRQCDHFLHLVAHVQPVNLPIFKKKFPHWLVKGVNQRIWTHRWQADVCGGGGS